MGLRSDVETLAKDAYEILKLVRDLHARMTHGRERADLDRILTKVRDLEHDLKDIPRRIED